MSTPREYVFHLAPKAEPEPIEFTMSEAELRELVIAAMPGVLEPLIERVVRREIAARLGRLAGEDE